jgi:hypothetical protein
MHVDSYRFGNIVVDGRKYTNDLIIFPDKLQADWWRQSGHSLVMDDLESVLKWAEKVRSEGGKPMLVIGRGAMKVMSVPSETLDALKELGINVESYRTSKAVERFNELSSEGKDVAGAFHLTC